MSVRLVRAYRSICLRLAQGSPCAISTAPACYLGAALVTRRGTDRSAGGAGEVGGDDVGGVPVEGCAGATWWTRLLQPSECLSLTRVSWRRSGVLGCGHRPRIAVRRWCRHGSARPGGSRRNVPAASGRPCTMDGWSLGRSRRQCFGRRSSRSSGLLASPGDAGSLGSQVADPGRGAADRLRGA